MTTETQTATKPAVVLEQPDAPNPKADTTALAKSQEAALSFSRELFTRERVELIKKQICPSGITDGEFAVFLEKCRRSGLDPIMNEAYCVPRSTTVKDADGRERKIEQFVFQASEQGMEVRAHRSGSFLGLRAGAVYSNDDCAIDFAGGKVRHLTNPAKPRGDLIGAWAIAFRRDLEVSPVAFVRFAEYVGLGPLWKNKPETMIVKVARAQALRLSFPYEFAGAYIPEEMGNEAIDVVGELVKTASAGPPLVEQKASKAEKIAKAIKPVPSSYPESQHSKAKPTPPAGSSSAPTSNAIPMSAMRFGSAKGKSLLECTGAELLEGIELAQKALADPASKGFAQSLQQRLEVMEAERSRRAAAIDQQLDALDKELDGYPDHPSEKLGGEPAREPGSEG